MRIVEEDFIMEPCGYGKFDISFKKKVKDKETGKITVKQSKPHYGCTLSTCLKKIIHYRLNSKYESESVYLLDALNEIISLEKELIKLCKESND